MLAAKELIFLSTNDKKLGHPPNNCKKIKMDEPMLYLFHKVKKYPIK